MGGGRFAPDREAGEGTAARPGRRTLLLTADDAEAAAEQAHAQLPEELQVKALQKNGSIESMFASLRDGLPAHCVLEAAGKKTAAV